MKLSEFTARQEQLIKEAVAVTAVDLSSVGQAMVKVQAILKDTQQFVARYTFTDVEEEIQFFKTIKPSMLSSFLYHKKIFRLLLFDSYSNAPRRLENYDRVLRKFELFARRNREFYEYCVSGNVYMDRVYFTRGTNVAVEVDDKFSTRYDRKLAKILAHQNVRDFVQQAIGRLTLGASSAASPTLQWTVSKVSLVELMYALHTCGVFNHGNADLKQIATAFEAMFGVHLNNYAKVFAEVKMRKNGNAVFLDQMKARLTMLINDSY